MNLAPLALTEPAMIGTAIFGLVVGLLYPWSGEADQRTPFPVALLIVGLAFFAVIGTSFVLQGLVERAQATVGRVVLWALFCSALYLGSQLRYYARRRQLMRHVDGYLGRRTK